MVAHIDSTVLGINQVQPNNATISSAKTNKHRDRRIRRNQLKYSNRFSPLRRQSHIVQYANDKNKTRRALRTITNTNWNVTHNNNHNEVASNRNAIDYRNYRINGSPVKRKSRKNLFGVPVQKPLQMDYKDSLRNEFTPLVNRWSMRNETAQNRYIEATKSDFKNEENIFDTNITLVPVSYSMIPDEVESFSDSYSKFEENVVASSSMILDDTMENKENPLKRKKQQKHEENNTVKCKYTTVHMLSTVTGLNRLIITEIDRVKKTLLKMLKLSAKSKSTESNMSDVLLLP